MRYSLLIRVTSTTCRSLHVSNSRTCELEFSRTSMVATLFGAALATQYRYSVAGTLAEANHPVAVLPPQWLPVLLAAPPPPPSVSSAITCSSADEFAEQIDPFVVWSLSCSDGTTLSGGAPYSSSEPLAVALGATCTLEMTTSSESFWDYWPGGNEWSARGFGQSFSLAEGGPGTVSFVVQFQPPPPSPPPPPLPPSPSPPPVPPPLHNHGQVQVREGDRGPIKPEPGHKAPKGDATLASRRGLRVSEGVVLYTRYTVV